MMDFEEYTMVESLLVDLACMREYIEDIKGEINTDNADGSFQRLIGAIESCERTIETLKDPLKRMRYYIKGFR